MMKIPLLFFMSLYLTAAASGAERSASEAYARMDYQAAAELAMQTPDSPRSKLIAALCDLYDPLRPNIERGRKGLKALYADPATPPELRAEAALELGRSAQLMKQRPEVYGKSADETDHLALFRAVMKLSPGTPSCRDAFFYLMSEMLEAPETREQAFEELEAFFREFPGEPKLLSPLRLLAEYQYIRQRNDYASAIGHLEAGCETGFANPGEDRAALFRLGFLRYRKLGDRSGAKRTLLRYLERYPLSAQAVVAKRYLKELGDAEQ